jgi:hypothetical protein
LLVPGIMEGVGRASEDRDVVSIYLYNLHCTSLLSMASLWLLSCVPLLIELEQPRVNLHTPTNPFPSLLPFAPFVSL